MKTARLLFQFFLNIGFFYSTCMFKKISSDYLQSNAFIYIGSSMEIEFNGNKNKYGIISFQLPDAN